MSPEMREQASSRREVNVEDSMKIPGYIELNPESNAPIHTYGHGYPERRPSDGTITPTLVNTSTAYSTRLETVREESKDRVHLGFYLSKRILTLLFLGIFLAVATLSIGLGLGLSLKNQGSSGVVRQLYGAFNGSGIVALDLGNISIPKITTYTQDVNGTIIQSEFSDGSWTEGTDADAVMAVNARNSTPLMALSYVNDDELTWRVFYVTEDNFLAESINSNKSTGWSSGPLRSSNFAVSTSPHVGLSACVNDAWYGLPYNINGLGIRLYYGSSNNSIQEITWALGDTAWSSGSNFPNSNGQGGVECTVRELSVTNVWMENLNGELQHMWYEFNTSTATPTHPVDQWVTGQSYGPIRPNSAISAIIYNGTNFVHFQAPNSSIQELETDGVAENMTWGAPMVVGTQNGIPGTRIGSVVLDTHVADGQDVHVLFQTNSSDMVDFVRTLDGLNWALYYVPVGVS